jgi:GT2 family glycosyltransferase
MDFSVIIVTYNSAPCIADCVLSVWAQEGVEAEVVVVDNASTDDTVRVVRELGRPLRLEANRQNIGFGQACNQGVAGSRGRLLFLLNPDAQLMQRDGLARLGRTMEEHPCWGVAGTRVIRLDGREEPPATAYPDQHRVRRDFSHLPGTLAWVYGASLSIRREVFSAVDGFDPGFFISSEETDLCLRVRQHGREIGFVPEVTVRHIGMASERGRDPYDTWRDRMTGLIRFWSKHYPPEDVLRLARKDRLRSRFRREWYHVAAQFGGPGSRAWLKYRKYAGISEAARRLRRAGPGPATTMNGKRVASWAQAGPWDRYVVDG